MQSLDLDARAAFHEWLDRVLAGYLPQDIVAFVLHLYEGTRTFDAQLAGTRRFEPLDPAWAYDECWSTDEDLFGLGRTRTGDSWEVALRQFASLMREYLTSGARAELLRRATAVAVGFVDGDLTLISNGHMNAATTADDAGTELNHPPQTQFVWVFNGERNRFPSGVFSSRGEGERWITANRARGTLTKYPVGMSVYDWAVSNGAFVPRKPEHTSADFIANFSSASQEHAHFDGNDDI